MSQVHGEPSIHLASPELDFDLTLRGGHLAPVVFHLPGRDVSPYALAPWQPSEFEELPPLLSVLRGDFFCLPFGGQDHGPPHGDPANAEWTIESQQDRSLHLRMNAQDSGAVVDKILTIVEGHHAVYAEHRISGLDGNYNYGTHPILDLSGLPEGSGRVSVSPFRWASVFPGVFANPADGEQGALASGAAFSNLHSVPLQDGGTTDLTRYPARSGNEDLVMMVSEPPSAGQPFAWSAVVLDGYVWFALKNPADFPATLFWLSNGGRSAPPWSGRHVGRIGIEEVCSYFSNGVDLSRRDLLAEFGIPTSRQFSKLETVSLRVIQATALLPVGFDVVSSIHPVSENSIAIRSESGKETTVAIDWSFVL